MPPRRSFYILFIPTLGFAALAFSAFLKASAEEPAPAGPPEHTVVHGGQTFDIHGGKIFRREGDKRVFVDTLYEAGYREKNYRFRDGKAFRVHDGKEYETRRTFSEDFEGVSHVREMINASRGWTSMTLQSPRTPEVRDYVALRKRILEQGGDFIDNRLDLAGQHVHGGKQALRVSCAAKMPEAVCTKCSIDTELLHFVKGDDVFFRAWYFIEGQTRPFTLMDLESTWLLGWPGLRIRITEDGYLDAELKWLDKPVYRQAEGTRVLFPLNQWVKVEAHFKLSDEQDGLVELFQDGRKLVSQRGQTLPLRDTILNNFEVGISAHSFGSKPALLWVDDVAISAEPLKTR